MPSQLRKAFGTRGFSRTKTVQKRIKGVARKARRTWPYTVGGTRKQYARHMKAF